MAARFHRQPGRALRELRAALVAAIALGALAAAAPARAAFGGCPSGIGPPITCETVTVPLDRSGAVPGNVNLFVERWPGAAPVHGVVVALAGGPGQAATPLTPQFAQVLAPALRGRDLIVFDERGVGRSDPISCPSLAARMLTSQAVTACAVHLGNRRGFYTSRDTADDIEAVRQSLGVGKIALYGASYGTYKALTYARRYPSHVESLVLDSMIGPDGRDPFERSTFAAIRRVIGGLCTGDCRGITSRPLAQLARLVARARRRSLRITAFNARGRRVKLRVGAETLLASVVASDLDPTVRAELPAVLGAELHHDGAPLARLLLRQRPLLGGAAGSSAAAFFATGCEEMPLPWSRTAPLSSRPAAVSQAIRQIPPATFAPWTRATELRTGITAACIGWPDASAQSPAVGGPVPDVPMLGLEGGDDMRTPLEDGQAVLRLFPHGSLVVVPHVGHSVLGTDVSGCASAALSQFFGGQAVASCPASANPFPPLHLLPRSLRRVPPRVFHGRVGRTLAGVEDTLGDATLQALDFTLFTSRIAAGGLRGGFMRGSATATELTVRLHHFVTINGVVLDGTLRIQFRPGLPHTAHVRVTGSGAHGTLTFTRTALRGRLDGRRVNLVAASGLAPDAWLRAIERLVARGGLRSH